MEHTSPQQRKTDMTNDSASPKIHETSLADMTTDNESNAIKHDNNKNIHEPPQLCEPPSKRPNLELV